LEDYAGTREVLLNRWKLLRRRVDQMEEVAQKCGFTCEVGDSGLIQNPILQRFSIDNIAESARADAAIRRLDRREFGCCIMCGGTIDPDELRRHPYSVNCNRCASRFPTTYGDDVRIQHEDLIHMWMSLLEVVSSVCYRVLGELPVNAEICACQAIINCVYVELDEHFQNEEKGGYLRAALDAAPQFERRARYLNGQHPEFSRRLSTIQAKLPDLPPLPLPWSQLQLDIQSLVEDLIEHEEEENEILSAAFLDDLGGEG
jgi:RNA polymerase-binding transcription factor DksA